MPLPPSEVLRRPHSAARCGVEYLEVDVDDKTMQLLKAMREQLGKTSASRTVDAVAAANSLGLDRSTLAFHRSMHNLVRAGYLEEPADPALTSQGKYLITFEGIAVADNY
jgi:DNA-binding IclR family transcriptional regulator